MGCSWGRRSAARVGPERVTVREASPGVADAAGQPKTPEVSRGRLQVVGRRRLALREVALQ